MIRDLAGAPGQNHEVDCDVLIVGGGTVGLLLATRLSAAGRHVVVAESGGVSQIGETHPLNEVVQLGARYGGAEAGRFRCLGGTSTRWGGAMLPFLEADMTRGRPGSDVEWPLTLADLTAYQHELETIFGLPESPYERPEIMPGSNGPAAFVPRLAKWPPFNLRNVAMLLGEKIKSRQGPTVWLNATVTRFGFDPAGLLNSVEARSADGASLVVRAKETVVAAGAIESTRLLLLADHQNDNRIFTPDDVLGRYFHDHLSAETARLAVSNRTALNRVIGFRFEGKGMRNLRFEPSEQLREAHGLPAGFIHIAFSTESLTGFDVLRTCYRKIQRRDRPTSGDLASLAFVLPWLTRAAWWRFYEKRLLFPDNANFNLHVVVEQEPLAANRIGLSPRRIDAFGCPLATIDWRVGDNDIVNAIALTKHFISAWRESPLAHLAEIEPMPAEAVREALSNAGGIYHPGGSTKMGTGPRNGVVDRDLRTFRVPNLSVLSTSVFPSGGGANPTMMLMMAALRAADRLAGDSPDLRLPITAQHA